MTTSPTVWTVHGWWILKYQISWRQQGARWGAYAQKTRQRRRERLSVALGLATTGIDDAAEAFASLVPVLERVAEAFAAIDPRMLEVEMTPLERAWSWITDTYYRGIGAWRR